jgi:predicted nucleotidyltransferase
MYLDGYINQIRNLCYQNKVRHLFVFGSILTNKFTEKSDIDLIVDISSDDPIDYAENYFNLKFQLEDLLKRPIDLLEERGLKNRFLRESINKSKKLLYEA